ncbi:MAG: fused MFS/spermidine synthase [Acidobacteriota bacterium]
MNTLGAAAGAIAGGFLLIPHLGFQRTLVASGVLNLTVAAIAAFLPSPREAGTSPRTVGPGADVAPAAVLLFLATSGAITMAWEVVFSRLTALVFGSSVYSFAVVVAAFLAGIGLGGLAHHASREGGNDKLPLLAGLGSLSVFLVSLLAGKLPSLSVGIHHAIAARFGLLRTATFGTMFVLLLPPALFLGMTFPAAIDALAGRLSSIGRAAGIGTAVNTMGAAVGAIAAGFWLLPRIGLESLLEGSALLGIVVALAMEASRPRRAVHRARRLAFLASAAALGAVLTVGQGRLRWSKAELTEGVFRTYARYQSGTEMRAAVGLKKLLYYRDGPAATVAVFETGDGSRSLRVNGKADASTGPTDMQTQLLAGHLPALLHGHPRTALVIGLGSGSTVHTLSEYPTMRRVDVAELEPSVVEAAGAFFTSVNKGALAAPNVVLHVEDGRRFVRRTRERYDIVVSEPSNPWVAGVSDLYTREHLERVLGILEDDGIFVQWIHGYSLGRTWVLATLHTVSDVFPEVSLWFSNHGDFMLLGSRKPLVLDLDRVRHAIRTMPDLEAELGQASVYGARGLVARYLLGTDEVRRESRGAPLIQDDLPLLEYFGPKDLHVPELDALNYQAFAAVAVPCPVRGSPVSSPEEANEWLWLATSARQVSRPILALPAFEASANLDPRAETYQRWADYEKSLGDLASAGALTARGLAIAPDDPALLRLQGELNAPGSIP